MLVIGAHSFFFFQEKMATCMKSHWVHNIIPFTNGDMGIDLFFIPSGFLVGYGLLNQIQKSNGNLDFYGFIRNRFLRLWPVLFVWNSIALPIFVVIFGLFEALKRFYLPNLFFVNNYYGEHTHLWSLAVEF